jgi:uncharacterized membrane protein YeaQ/YmgE (transglycosylase-associated protein family)
MAEVIKEYVTGFVSAIIAFTIGVTLAGYLVTTVGNVHGVPLLTPILVGTIVGAGLLLFILKAFI